jgi:hypothetical protein
MRWTARVVELDGGRQVIQVRLNGYFVGQYSSVQELRADPQVPVDQLELEGEADTRPAEGEAGDARPA